MLRPDIKSHLQRSLAPLYCSEISTQQNKRIYRQTFTESLFLQLSKIWYSLVVKTVVSDNIQNENDVPKRSMTEWLIGFAIVITRN